MMPPWLKMHCRGALEAVTAKTLMANDQIRHSTADSLMLRMSCIVTLLNFVNGFLSWSTDKNEVIIINLICLSSCWLGSLQSTRDSEVSLDALCKAGRDKRRNWAA